MMEKVEGLTNEKDRLVHERDKLKESRDELQDRIVARSGTAGDNAGNGQGIYYILFNKTKRTKKKP